MKCPDCGGRKYRRNARKPSFRELEREYIRGNLSILPSLVQLYLREEGHTLDLNEGELTLLRERGGVQLFLWYLKAKVEEEPFNRSRWRTLLNAAREANFMVVVPGYPLPSDWTRQGLTHFTKARGQPVAMTVRFIASGSTPGRPRGISWFPIHSTYIWGGHGPDPNGPRGWSMRSLEGVFGYLVMRRVTPWEGQPLQLGGEVRIPEGWYPSASTHPVPWESIAHNAELRVDYQIGAAASMREAARNIKLIPTERR